MRELDLIVGAWALRNLSGLSHENLVAFNQQVLKHETPDLLKKILGQQPISESEEYVKQIRLFALDKSVSKI